MPFVDNLELGGAGLVDLVEQKTGLNPTSHLAADTYAQQTAESQGLTVEEGAGLASAAQLAEADGVVNKAARNTIDQVAAKVTKGLGYLPWVLAGVGVVVVVGGLAYLKAATPRLPSLPSPVPA